MALFDETVSDTLSVLDVFADDLLTPDDGIFFDRLTDEVSDLTDLMLVGRVLGRLSADTLSLDPDSIALANSYQYNHLDAVSLSDQILIETTFNVDPITVDDQVTISRTVGAAASDAVSATDLAVTGFERWANPHDSVSISDQTALAGDYHFSLSDAVAIADVPHTWKVPGDEKLSADFEGDGDLRAVLLKRKLASNQVVTPPPRNVVLPKPPVTRTEHNVVDPNPSNRQPR